MCNKSQWITIGLMLLFLIATITLTSCMQAIADNGSLATPPPLIESAENTFTSTTTPETEIGISPTSISTEQQIQQQEYFVADYGNDNNPGTKARPWKTIQHAIEQLSRGEVAIIQEGTYDERVQVHTHGITLKAAGKVILRGFDITGNENIISGFLISDPSSEAGIWIQGDNNLISGNEITQMKQDGVWFFGDGNVISGNYIHNILSPEVRGDPHSDCFQTWGPATNTTLNGNLCVHTRESGSNQIAMIEGMDGPIQVLTIKNNIFVIDDPGYSPFNIHRKSGQHAIEDILIANNNFIHRNGIGQYGVQLIGTTRAVIVNNLFIDFGTTYNPYVNVLNSSDIDVDYNAVYKTDGQAPEGGPFDHDVWMMDLDLQGDEELNFQPNAGSPLVDAGKNIEGVDQDFNGVSRPQGEKIDIGALEFIQN